MVSSIQLRICGMWYQHVTNKSLVTPYNFPVSYVMELPQTEPFAPIQATDAWLDRCLRDLEATFNIWDSFCVPQTILKKKKNPSSMAWHIMLLKEGPVIGEYPWHDGIYLVCNDIQVNGRCWNMVHMNDLTKGFLAEHCLKHHPPSTGLFLCCSASCCQHFPQVNNTHNILCYLYSAAESRFIRPSGLFPFFQGPFLTLTLQF